MKVLTEKTLGSMNNTKLPKKRLDLSRGIKVTGQWFAGGWALIINKGRKRSSWKKKKAAR